jgi:hypothetical protein
VRHANKVLGAIMAVLLASVLGLKGQNSSAQAQERSDAGLG